MLTPEYIAKLPEQMAYYYQLLEDEALRDIIRAVNRSATLTDTAELRIKALLEMGYDIRELDRHVGERVNIGNKELSKLIHEAGLQSYANDVKAYSIGGKLLRKFAENNRVLNVVKAAQKSGVLEFTNLTKTMGIADNFRETVSQATIEVVSGGYSGEAVVKKTINKLSSEGVLHVNYPDSNRRYTIDAAVRMTVRSTVNRLSAEMGLINAEDMEQDLMELTAHMGARPSHADWQGELVSLSGRSGYLDTTDIGYGDPGGFMGVNCRHNWYPFFEGISKRAYSEEQLENIDPEPFNYNGKEYTYYDATQRQRALERQARATKRELVMYDEIGAEEDFTTASIKLERIRKEYRDFTDAAGLKDNSQRMHTFKFDTKLNTKSYWATQKPIKDNFTP